MLVGGLGREVSGYEYPSLFKCVGGGYILMGIMGEVLLLFCGIYPLVFQLQIGTSQIPMEVNPSRYINNQNEIQKPLAICEKYVGTI